MTWIIQYRKIERMKDTLETNKARTGKELLSFNLNVPVPSEETGTQPSESRQRLCNCEKNDMEDAFACHVETA